MDDVSVANEVEYSGADLEENLRVEEMVSLEDAPVVENLEPREIPWDADYEEFSVPSDIFTLNYRRSFNELMRRVQDARHATPEGTARSGVDTVRLRVDVTRRQAAGVTSFELVDPSGADLPPWEPGAHVDLHLPSGRSVEAHRVLRPGIELDVGRPPTTFTLKDADCYLFIAGGIGITPLLPMIREAHDRGTRWNLVFGARTAEHFDFVQELKVIGGDRVQLLAQDMAGLPDFGSLVDCFAGAAVYSCGPPDLLDALTVELARSGPRLLVEAGQSILEAVREVGVAHPSSCERGICGTCEVKVLDGVVDHRDNLLSDEEKAADISMMICVSGAACPRLVLDL